MKKPYTESNREEKGILHMRQLYVDSREIEDEAGVPFCFDYYLLVGELDVGPFFCESYGVRIVQRGADNEASQPNVTTSASRVDSLLERLISNCVSPVSLPDVLSDWL